MAKIGVFYGSSTGTCEDVAGKIAAKLDGADVLNAADLTADSVAVFDVLLLGSSTWGAGELQDDWYDACETLHNLDLKGKKVALFAVGDSACYPDTFCGALAPLYDAVKESGAEVVGQVSAEGYTFDDSEGVVDGNFLGLALDEANEPDLTDGRIDAWIKELGL